MVVRSVLEAVEGEELDLFVSDIPHHVNRYAPVARQFAELDPEPYRPRLDNDIAPIVDHRLATLAGELACPCCELVESTGQVRRLDLVLEELVAVLDEPGHCLAMVEAIEDEPDIASCADLHAWIQAEMDAFIAKIIDRREGLLAEVAAYHAGELP